MADKDNRQYEGLVEHLPEDTEEPSDDFEPDVSAEPSGDNQVDELLDEETSDVDEWRSFLDEFETDADDDERPIFVVATENEYDATESADTDRNEDYSDGDEPAADEELSALPLEEAYQHDKEDLEVVLEEETCEDEWVDYRVTSADIPTDGDDADQSAQLEGHEPDDESVPAPWDSDEPGNAVTFSYSSISWKKIAATMVLAAALLIQLVHYNRDSLAAHTTYGPAVRDIYAMFSAELYPEWNLDDYAIRNQEAIGSLTSQRALNILAKIEVVGQQPVAPPLIRVKLLDRWGKSVGSREFGPMEYRTDNSQPVAMLKPGMTIPVLVQVLDPGIDAQGYEIDICLPSRQVGLRCQKDSNPFQP